MSPRNTTRPFFLVCFVSNSAFFKWQRSINDAKCTFLPSFLASSITSDLFLTCVLSHAWIFSTFSHSYSTASFAAFAAGYLHCLRHRNKFVYQIVMLYWIVPSSCNMVLMVFCLRFFHTHSCGFTGFQSTHKSWFEIISLATGLTMLTLLARLARQSGSHCVSNFLLAFFDDFLQLHVLRVNEINSS